MKKLALLAALAAASLSTTAFAAEGNGGFIRAELGETRAKFDIGSITDTAYSIRGGYFFNRNVAIEGFYTGHGRDSYGGTTVEAFSVGVGVVGKKNFEADHKGFFISGRAGIAYTDIAVVDRNSVEFLDDDRDASLYAGVGLGYDFTEKFGLSLNYDYQKADISGADVKLNTWTIGGEFRF
ncbi:MAG: porin family protein [Lysobacter sp.]|nr:porin family protein [Lysobacter sp.]